MSSPEARRLNGVKINGSTPQRFLDRSSSRNNRSSPQLDGLDSPSRQLIDDLNRLVIDQELHFQKGLDKREAEQRQRHESQLAFSAAEHNRIRANAELARERVELEIERERRRRETEERNKLEQERRAKAAQEEEDRRREKDDLKRREEEQTRRQTEEREIQDAKQQLEEQKQKAEREAADRKRQQEEAAKEKAKQAAEAARNATAAQQKSQSDATAQQPPSTSSQTDSQPRRPDAAPQSQTASTNGISSAAIGATAQSDRERQHARYLKLHKDLKQMREYVVTQSKQIPALKSRLGDWRREITKCMGQLTTDKVQNRKPMSQIQSTLLASIQATSPEIDISPYLISQPLSSQGPHLMSGPFIYLLNIFAKAAIRQFISESSGGAKSADPVGVVVVTIFANQAFKLHSTTPLIDILLAKYHAVCPVLWGIHGPSNTPAGRIRLGWWRYDGAWIPEQRHIERMAGLASGFASMSLRDFSKSRNENPFPNTNYWHALAGIVNVPTAEVQATHFTVLKGLIDGYVPRFIGFYGGAAVAALRLALVDFPARAKTKGDKGVDGAADQVVVLGELVRRDLKLTLG